MRASSVAPFTTGRVNLHYWITCHMDGQHTPDWVATDPTIRQRRQISTVEGSIVTGPS